MGPVLSSHVVVLLIGHSLRAPVPMEQPEHTIPVQVVTEQKHSRRIPHSPRTQMDRRFAPFPRPR